MLKGFLKLPLAVLTLSGGTRLQPRPKKNPTFWLGSFFGGPTPKKLVPDHARTDEMKRIVVRRVGIYPAGDAPSNNYRSLS